VTVAQGVASDESRGVEGVDYVGLTGNRAEAIKAALNGLVSFANPYDIFDDELANNWTESSVGGGTVKRGARSKVLLNTSATGGGLAVLLRGSNRNSSGFPLHFPNGAGSKFIFEMRTRLTTAIGSVDELGAGDSTEWLVGVRGASSTGFWVARFSNGPTLLTSTVAIDNGTFRRLRVWRDGTTTFFQVDSETPVSSAAAWATNEERLHLRAYNGGATNAREMEIDYIFLRTEAT
jgi:hypothetical protein